MVTIKEIAKAVGVSSATVSRVLNYDPALSISPAKRQAIIETAEALNYETPRNRNKANGHAAPSLLTRLVIVHFLEPSDEIADPYYVGVRLGIENRCRDLKTEIVKVFHSDALPEAALLESASGVIVIGKHSDNEIAWVAEHSRHLVFADFDPKSDHIDSVFSDMGLATRKILDCLKASGYSRIGFIGSHESLNGGVQHFAERRCAAYIEWQKKNGTFAPDLLALADCSGGQSLRLDTGYRLARDLLALTDRPDVNQHGDRHLPRPAGGGAGDPQGHRRHLLQRHPRRPVPYPAAHHRAHPRRAYRRDGGGPPAGAPFRPQLRQAGAHRHRARLARELPQAAGIVRLFALFADAINIY
jgi:LacI family transcriptional regulator